ARHPERTRGGVHASHVEAGLGGVERPPLASIAAVAPRASSRAAAVAITRLPAPGPDQVGRGYAQAVEGEVPREEAVVADLVDGLAGQSLREGVALLLDDDGGQAARPWLVRRRVGGAAQQLDEVGCLGEPDPPLLAGDHVL